MAGAAVVIESNNRAARDAIPRLGLGVGWRPQLAWMIDRCPDLTFVEITAENFTLSDPIPAPLERLRRRGTTIVPHGIALSLGSADRPDPARLKFLARTARRYDSPLVSEHLAFVRAGGTEAGHLLPLSRTRAMANILVENIRVARDALPVPLALENIAAFVEWPESEMDEGEFITDVLERSGALLLLDVENIYANARNHGGDPAALLDRLPLHRLAYTHLAGGVERDGLYHDTHAHPIPPGVIELLEELAARTDVPGAMIERDGRFAADGELLGELSSIAQALKRGDARRGGA